MDGAGALARRWEWEPFGTARAESGTTQARFGYGGEERDDETGLVNLRARYYDPAIGRFLSRDSLAGAATLPQSWNRYSYTENDPINHLDPSGHAKERRKVKWPMGMDPDDDDRARKKAKACRNPGQYTGSCKNGPPNAAYAADGEAQHAAKKAGQAAASGNLAAAAAYLSSAQHFASIAGTAAAQTAAIQAYASILAAMQSMVAARSSDNRSTGMIGAEAASDAGPAEGSPFQSDVEFSRVALGAGSPWWELLRRLQAALLPFAVGAKESIAQKMAARNISVDRVVNTLKDATHVFIDWRQEEPTLIYHAGGKKGVRVVLKYLEDGWHAVSTNREPLDRFLRDSGRFERIRESFPPEWPSWW